MKKIIVIAFCLSLALFSEGQVSYNLSAVPDSIKKNANVIVQFENQVFTIEGLDDATLHVHRIYTVVNEDGRYALNFSEYTTKFISLTDADLKVYDVNGKLISKHKKKEMVTRAVGDGLIEDGYVVSYFVNTSNYPVTIDLEYEMKFKGTLFYPSYDILTSETGVLKSSFTAKVPSSLDLRYKPKNITLQPVIKDEGKLKTYTWEVRNLPPVEDEKGAVDNADRFPSIELAPNKFSIYGSTGDLSSWKNYGLWIRQLYKGLDELSVSRKGFFFDLV